MAETMPIWQFPPMSKSKRGIALAASEEELETTGDGRVQRGARNRTLILDALIELIREGDLRPTAELVAKRAGVGLRTLFRHFDDMEALFADMNGRVAQEVRQAFDSSAPPLGHLASRIHRLVELRTTIFERIAPFMRSAQIQRPFSPYLQKQYAKTCREMRQQLEKILSSELDGKPELLEILDTLLSFESFNRLRTTQRLSRATVSASIEKAIRVLLGA